MNGLVYIVLQVEWYLLDNPPDLLLNNIIGGWLEKQQKCLQYIYISIMNGKYRIESNTMLVEQ